jgi:hypothetical protein
LIAAKPHYGSIQSVGRTVLPNVPVTPFQREKLAMGWALSDSLVARPRMLYNSLETSLVYSALLAGKSLFSGELVRGRADNPDGPGISQTA